MYEKFPSLDYLYQEMDRDKHIADVGIASANRYPLRFVLFENFSDFYNFVFKCAEKGIQVVGIEKWLKVQKTDVFPTYSTLAKKICDYIKHSNGRDAVIAPFSELARFYTNEDFRGLIKTIRLQEANLLSQESHLRIYVPIIGMQNKLDSFKNDNEIRVWEYGPVEAEKPYRLILCRGTQYQLPKEESLYSYSDSAYDWVTLWEKGDAVKQSIVCCSRAIFENARNAMPDNAFEYVICHNSFELLQDGLRLIPQSIQLNQDELPHWDRLTSEIKDIKNFSFSSFVLRRFNVLQMGDLEFMHYWLKEKDAFSRWLLKTYYLTEFPGSSYLRRVLGHCRTLHTSELFEQLALGIFEEDCKNVDLQDRHLLLDFGKEHGVRLSEVVECELKKKLEAIAQNPEYGVAWAMKYVTSLSDAEKQLMVAWLGEGRITREDIKEILPDLYAYTAALPHNLFCGETWCADYFSEYICSKISDKPTAQLKKLLKEHNDSSASFESWRNEFKTVKTVLWNRDDIEVYYWIDGLGVDWLPFLKCLVEKHQDDGVYLNEVYVATAQLPTTTFVNKTELESLPNARINKVGDLDTYAHKSKKYPDYICQELELVRTALEDALNQYNGKKIAIVSDHGISYMAQHGAALALADASSEHAGRCATWQKLPVPQDKRYVIAPNEEMICSLSYDSLADKTPCGQGAHGGATPEEVLVPILIISAQKNQSNYTAKLLQRDLSINEPIVIYEIKGMQAHSMEVPVVQYNGKSYTLHKTSNNRYVSEPLSLRESVNSITLEIGAFSQTDMITVKIGVNEDDIFGDF